jgi:SAM-dependent methyltransferase
VSHPGREHLRSTFEEVPELYERARPSYPEAILDDLVALARLPPGARLLEIGPGTGQATVPLAARGFHILCVELGPALADRARRNLERFENVHVVQADFETWDPAGLLFDCVVAFTAFHWVAPEVRYSKSADALRETGKLAVVATKHVLPAGGDPFWVEVQEDYEAIDEDAQQPPSPDQVADMSEEIEASGLFGDVEVRRHLWEVAYSADEYINVLETYSGHRKLPPTAREELYKRIRLRIAARPDGRVRKTYLGTLHVASRQP